MSSEQRFPEKQPPNTVHINTLYGDIELFNGNVESISWVADGYVEKGTRKGYVYGKLYPPGYRLRDEFAIVEIEAESKKEFLQKASRYIVEQWHKVMVICQASED